jgi:hypothetical protein
VQIDSKIAEAIKEAEKACDDGSKEDCATAWDEVEELSAAASHKKDAVCVGFDNERIRFVFSVTTRLYCLLLRACMGPVNLVFNK